MDIIERFKKYIAIDTRSNGDKETCPSTAGQLKLGDIILKDLKEMGIYAQKDKNGYIYGSIPSNIDRKVPTIGFIAHMDTAPDMDGQCLNPQKFIYKGGDIKLNKDYVMKCEDFPFLKDLVGEELITTDGTTLLGADDKAGIVEILDAMDYIVKNDDIKHGEIKIGFTPDEEIGRGADLFDVEKFGADFAYTIDGGPLGELEYENFNAATAIVKIQGKNVHPGSAKNVMVNSLLVAMELESLLPKDQKPESTEGYEGFFLLDEMNGSVDYTEMVYIIRDHSREKFEEKKALFTEIIKFLNVKYKNILELDLTDSYYNMKEKIEPHIEIVDLAKKSMIDLDIEPNIKAIRGGTDGARLSFMGLPCPNIFAGGYNFHGRYEFIPTDSMRKASKLIVKIIENNAKTY